MAGGSPGPTGPRTVGVPAASPVLRSPGTRGVGLGVRPTPAAAVGDACLARVSSDHKPWERMPPSESPPPSRNEGVRAPASLGREAQGAQGSPSPPLPPRDPQPLSPRLPGTRQPRAGNLPVLRHRTEGPRAQPSSRREAGGGFTTSGRKAPGMEPSHGPAHRQRGSSHGGQSRDRVHKGRRNHAQQQHKETLRSLSRHSGEPGAAAAGHLTPAAFWGPLPTPTKHPAPRARHCQSLLGRQLGSGRGWEHPRNTRHPSPPTAASPGAGGARGCADHQSGDCG